MNYLFSFIYYRPHTWYGGRLCFHGRLSFCPQYVGWSGQERWEWWSGQRGGLAGGSHPRKENQEDPQEGRPPPRRKTTPLPTITQERSPGRPIPPYTEHGNTVNARSVHILLECILVYHLINCRLSNEPKYELKHKHRMCQYCQCWQLPEILDLKPWAYE